MDDHEADQQNNTTYILTLFGLILPLILLPAAMVFSPATKFPVEGRTVILTGGSQGLGLALGKKLAARGANVVIVARDEEKLASALAEIEDSAHDPAQRFLSLSYDLTLPESAPAILKTVIDWNDGEPPEIVWNCAGYCTPSFFADASIHTLRSQMDTLYWSAAYMAHATLNLWKTPSPSKTANSTPPKPRHLIFTCSALAFFPVAGYSPYTPAKAAMRFLTDTLQHEVAIYNGAATSPSLPANEKPPAEMRVHTIFPMGITSPNFERENEIKPAVTTMLEKDDKPQSPDEVATAALRGLDQGRTMVATQLLGSLMLGAGMASSLRTGIGDVLWNWLGSLIVIFVGWDFHSKATKWGKEKGLQTGPKEASRA